MNRPLTPRGERPRISIHSDTVASLPSPITANLPKIPSWSESFKSTPSLGYLKMIRSNSVHKKDEEEPTTTRVPLSWRATIATQFEELQKESYKKWIPQPSFKSSRSSQSSWMSLLWEGNSAPRGRNASDAGSLSPAINHSGPLNDISSKFDTQRRKLALGKRGTFIVCLLLFLGLRELFKSSTAKTKRITVKGRNPFSVLSDLRSPPSHPLGSLSPLSHQWMANSVGRPGEKTADTTAIVLNWKRTENVGVIIASLCQYSFFDSILIWNNNPAIHLTRESFAPSKCPSTRLRIYNSPRNMYFFGRYLACAQASTPYCFFQDDDWLVKPLRALYSQFSRDPEGPIVVHTSPEVSTLFGWEWCFYNDSLNTCFSWVGTGAFVAKSHVLKFLALSSTLDYSREELSHADNSFTVLQNQPPYILSSELAQLPQPFGHSDGAGIERNKVYIEKGLERLTRYLSPNYTAPAIPVPLPLPLEVDTIDYLYPQEPPLSPHPYTHHARSPCTSDTCVFLSNIPLLPPPDSVIYPGPSIKLSTWENHLGWVARGWIEGGELFSEGETWANKWNYANAVDGKFETAFRSPETIQSDDYVGLGLLTAIDPQWIPTVRFNFVIEDIELVAHGLLIEVSVDGYHWVQPQLNPNGEVGLPTCKQIVQTSTAPDQSFPSTFLTIASTLEFIAKEKEEQNQSVIKNWWRRRTRERRRLSKCTALVATDLGKNAELGWRFIRLRSEVDIENIGWGIYEIYLD